ncbi:MAG: BlaI/MecI/CopY family transcriptional regulator [Lachnospiraceae bacterium]|jgi:Predicted transcriptional regulator|nr:BlaI/MecI/CopY family transcriptional regulator [Lachnospiraceae bacterium]RKI37985.1 BlaI/MecI/CopY family transcriptional regulator [bacterium D16-59]RKI54453.1 BlaI/MecI/CopY family transcriptional regulator [bacterium D16-51]
MAVKLFESELKVMDLLWKEGDLSAKEIAQRLKEQINWSKTTTYTVLKKCVEKQAILRTEPGFICKALISREEVQKDATEDLIDRMFGGSKDLLIASLLGNQEMTSDDIARLKKLAEDLK